MRAMSSDYFDALYQASDDPWRIEDNWYEQRKRALLTAMLPRRRFRNALEPGCGTGELTLALGPHCDHILASDLAPAAVDIARRRWQQYQQRQPNFFAPGHQPHCHARFIDMTLPADWPAHLGASFDLIVISELAYYLDAAALQRLPALINGSLADDGVLLACHWRHDFPQRLHDTASIHAGFDNIPALHRMAHYQDEDFLLDMWCRQPASIAQQQGLA